MGTGQGNCRRTCGLARPTPTQGGKNPAPLGSVPRAALAESCRSHLRHLRSRRPVSHPSGWGGGGGRDTGRTHSPLRGLLYPAPLPCALPPPGPRGTTPGGAHRRYGRPSGETAMRLPEGARGGRRLRPGLGGGCVCSVLDWACGPVSSPPVLFPILRLLSSWAGFPRGLDELPATPCPPSRNPQHRKNALPSATVTVAVIGTLNPTPGLQRSLSGLTSSAPARRLPGPQVRKTAEFHAPQRPASPGEGKERRGPVPLPS